jgi:hypothetical protein
MSRARARPVFLAVLALAAGFAAGWVVGPPADPPATAPSEVPLAPAQPEPDAPLTLSTRPLQRVPGLPGLAASPATPAVEERPSDRAALASGSVLVTIRDDAGAPLAGAEVVLGDRRHATYWDGTTVFGDVPPGRVTIEPQVQGFARTPVEVEIRPAEMTAVEVTLRRRDG